VAAAAYVPRYRLPRELIAREWGGQSAGGEKAVANHDEDSLTLAVSAALALEGQGERADAVFVATTASPYREKQGAATIATVLDLPSATRTADFADTLRAGTSALLAGLDTLAGGARRVLVAAGECRLGEPDSHLEQSCGDAGAAVLLGGGAARAEVIATHSIADEFLGTWRTREQEFPKSFPGAFEGRYGYGRVLGEAVKGLLARAGAARGADRLAADRGEADAPVLRALRALPEARAQGDGGERPVLGRRHVPRPQGAAPALRRQVPPLRHRAVPEAPRLHRVRARGRARGGEARAAREALHLHPRLPLREHGPGHRPRRHRPGGPRPALLPARGLRARAGRGRHAARADVPPHPRGRRLQQLLLEGETGTRRQLEQGPGMDLGL